MVKAALRDVVPGADDEQVDLSASAIIAMMDGLQVQWLLDPGAVRMPEAVELGIAAIIGRLRQHADDR
jgi:hypothetical protein